MHIWIPNVGFEKQANFRRKMELLKSNERRTAQAFLECEIYREYCRPLPNETKEAESIQKKSNQKKIKSEKESVASGTRTLAFEHYPTFIATSDCGKDAAVHLEASHKHVEKLSENLPPLRQACLDFESEAKSLSLRRKSTSIMKRERRLPGRIFNVMKNYDLI